MKFVAGTLAFLLFVAVVGPLVAFIGGLALLIYLVTSPEIAV